MQALVYCYHLVITRTACRFFMAYVKENQLESELDKLRLGNGKYYILPGFQRTVQVQQWIYRRDLFEKHNLGAPATYDELFDALVILKAAYPDSAPITACWGGAHLFAMMGAGYGIPAGWAGTRFYDSAADVWRFSPATERYRAMYSFLHRCYAAGLLDPALFTQTDAEYIDKLQSGTALVTVSWVSSGFASWDAKLEQNGVSGGEWAPLRVPASTMGIRAMPAVDPFRKGLVVASRVANEPYLDRLLGFLDWAVYSEEGRTLTAWGVEGVTYTNTDAGKAFVPDVQTPRNPAGTKVIEKDYGLDIMFDLNANAEYEDYKRPPEIVAFLDESLKAAEAAKVDPPLQLSPDAVETARIISDKLGPYVAESGTRFVVGELSTDTDWDGYLLELDRRGYKALEDTWNRAWAAQSQR